MSRKKSFSKAESQNLKLSNPASKFLYLISIFIFTVSVLILSNLGWQTFFASAVSFEQSYAELKKGDLENAQKYIDIESVTQNYIQTVNEIQDSEQADFLKQSFRQSIEIAIKNEEFLFGKPREVERESDSKIRARLQVEKNENELENKVYGIFEKREGR